MTTIAEEAQSVEQKPSFKLMKMSKGYNWECKWYSSDIEELKTKVKELDDWAKENYGNQHIKEVEQG